MCRLIYVSVYANCERLDSQSTLLCRVSVVVPSNAQLLFFLVFSILSFVTGCPRAIVRSLACFVISAYRSD